MRVASQVFREFYHVFNFIASAEWYIRYPGPDAMYEYDLFAVINHEGQIDNGHYTNYARFQDEVRTRYVRGPYIYAHRILSGIVLTMISMSFCDSLK